MEALQEGQWHLEDFLLTAFNYMTEFQSLIKKFRLVVPIYQLVSFFHFIRRVNINNLKLATSSFIGIVVNDFKNMNQAPVYPFTISIFH